MIVVIMAAALIFVTALDADAQAPIRIGASLSLTGTYAKLGKYQHEGYQLCQKDLNAQGGLLGRKVEFVVYDDQSMPPTGVRLYERLLDGPVLLARHRGGRQRDRKVQEGDGGAVGGDDRHLPEGASAQIHLHGPLARRGLLRRPHRHRDETWAQDGVVNEDTLFSKAAAAGAVNLAKKKGMQVVFQEAYPKGNTDFSGLLTKIKGVNPDVLAAATYFDDAVALTRQMRELNVNPKMYGVTIGGDLPEFYDTLKGNAEYVYGATQWEPALNYPGNREFVESYRAEFKREPSYFAAAGYAGCLVYTEGVKRAGSLDADKVREHILKLDLRTPFGEFKVDPDGVQLAHKMVTFQWQKEKKVIVWPDDLAQGKVLFPTPPWTSR